MSSAEEAPPPEPAPHPAVVPSPDDSAKEGTEQEAEVGEEEREGSGDISLILEEEEEDKEADIDVEKVATEEAGRSNKGAGLDHIKAERHGSVTIDPSYNPSGEELLYEGDVEAEAPLPKQEKEVNSTQDEGFIVSVHETGMELDMAESMSGSHANTTAKTEGKGQQRSSSSSRHSNAAEGGAKFGKGVASNKSTFSSDSKRTGVSSPTKEVDRLVITPSPIPPLFSSQVSIAMRMTQESLKV